MSNSPLDPSLMAMLRGNMIKSGVEPFTNLLCQGMVLKDGSKMSKSKGNVINLNNGHWSLSIVFSMKNEKDI